jgi:hypothetical protein
MCSVPEKVDPSPALSRWPGDFEFGGYEERAGGVEFRVEDSERCQSAFNTTAVRR